MKKNLIIGAFTKYNYNQLKPWVESIDEVVGKNVDKVVVVFDTDRETLEKLNARGWICIKAQASQNIPIHVERFVYIYNYLQENGKWDEYDYVVTTDVKDVYFQKDPFEWLESREYPFVAASESLLYKDEPWGRENMQQAFGDYFYNIFKDNPIFNVGTLAGFSDYVKDMCLSIFLMSMGRPIPIVDQAVYNVILNSEAWKSNTFFPDESEAWACQLGTVADPSKINFFRPFLLEVEPIISIDGWVYNENNELFVIVHQYDRVPELKAHIQKRYEQVDTSETFIYRT